MSVNACFRRLTAPTFRVMQKKSRPNIGRDNIRTDIALLADAERLGYLHWKLDNLRDNHSAARISSCALETKGEYVDRSLHPSARSALALHVHNPSARCKRSCSYEEDAEAVTPRDRLPLSR